MTLFVSKRGRDGTLADATICSRMQAIPAAAGALMHKPKHEGLMCSPTRTLTTEVLSAVGRHWEMDLQARARPLRLMGGEESAAYRLGAHVVRIGPAWRSDAELEWCHRVAAEAALAVPEAIAPRATKEKKTAIRVENRPISLWPFVQGERGSTNDPEQRREAARLLARLHSVLAPLDIGPPPTSGAPRAFPADLSDPQLDDWLVEFVRRHRKQPLHGDFYPGNVLVVEKRITGLIDWDEAYVGPPELELASAAWEWGDGLRTLDLTVAMEFVSDYEQAGGPAGMLNRSGLAHLVRDRIRRDVQYERSARRGGRDVQSGDREYEASQLHAFHALRRSY